MIIIHLCDSKYNVKFIWCVGHVIFELFFCVCFRKRRKKERVRSAEGRRRLYNSPFSSLWASSLWCSGGVAGKGNSNPYPKPLPPYPAPPPEHPVELARKLNVLVPNVKKAMGTWLYFLPTSFPGFLKPLEYPLWPDFFCVLFVLFFLVRKKSVELCNREKKACFWINNTRLAFQTCKTTIHRPHTPE